MEAALQTSKKVKVLIVDDSAVVRRLLTDILQTDPDIEVIATAPDAYVARDKIKRYNPDVITLDIEMPKMDGVTFLRNLMRLRPMPVVMISTLTEKGADVTLDALHYGAVDFITKPKIDVSHALQDYAEEIIEKVKGAAKARVKQYTAAPATAPLTPVLDEEGNHSVDLVLASREHRSHFKTTDKLWAVGASTGGIEAIRTLFETLPANCPGIVIGQHIPVKFSKAFADRLNRQSAVTVCEAKDGDQILPGHAYIAPGDRHLLVVRDGARWRCKLSDGVPVNRHKPSVDVLFRSVAQAAGPNAMAVILTGMGRDGAKGLLELREAGAFTIAQDEASSVVWGMPGSAVELGAAEEVLALDSITKCLLSKLKA